MSTLPASILPLDLQQTDRLQAVVSDLDADQLHWVSGYAAGLAAAASKGAPRLALSPEESASAAAGSKVLTILYGSQTGNGEELALSLANDAKSRGFAAEAVSLAHYKQTKLKRESLVSFVISTHGEGDPPDDAEIFREFLLADNAPDLSKLQFTVLALGDSSYINYCQTGREFDARLEALGAERVAPLVECDLDYEEPAKNWSTQLIDQLPELLGVDSVAVPALRAIESAPKFGKDNPFAAEVLVNQKITGGASTKDVRHLELSLEGSDIQYEPGDSLAVLVENPSQLVDDFLQALAFDGDAEVEVKGKFIRLADALTKKLEITQVNLSFLRSWVDLPGVNENEDSQLRLLLESEDSTSLSDFLDSHQIIDVVRQFPKRIGSGDFVSILRPLSARSYSIASSLAANPEEAHLTVAAVRYEAFGQQHFGAASTYLADRVAVGGTVSVYVEPNKRFRLPASNVPLVMIGPGTGVAPFRAFVEERIEQGASGKNWLIFGDRNADSDFLYQLEWQRYLKQGHLQRLDVAFSRDQAHKIYVQDRIRENGAEIYRWLEDGAALYVCGDAKQMAKDVHDALVQVISLHENIDEEGALQRLKELRIAGRYQRDVY